MALTWDVKDIKDYQEHFPDIVHEDGKRQWHTYMQVIPFVCLAVGMGQLTEKNIDEFISRVAIYETVFHPWLVGKDDKGKTVYIPLDPEKLGHLVGLSVNVPYDTRKQFYKRTGITIDSLLEKLMKSEVHQPFEIRLREAYDTANEYLEDEEGSLHSYALSELLDTIADLLNKGEES